MLCCFLSLFLFCCFSYFQYQFMIQWCNYLSSNAIKWRKSCQYLDVRSRYLLPFNVYHKSIPVHLQIQTCLLYRWLMFDKAVILSYIILYFDKTNIEYISVIRLLYNVGRSCEKSNKSTVTKENKSKDNTNLHKYNKKNYEGELVNTTRRLIGCCTSSIYATLFSFA